MDHLGVSWNKTSTMCHGIPEAVDLLSETMDKSARLFKQRISDVYRLCRLINNKINIPQLTQGKFIKGTNEIFPNQASLFIKCCEKTYERNISGNHSVLH